MSLQTVLPTRRHARQAEEDVLQKPHAPWTESTESLQEWHDRTFTVRVIYHRIIDIKNMFNLGEERHSRSSTETTELSTVSITST